MATWFCLVVQCSAISVRHLHRSLCRGGGCGGYVAIPLYQRSKKGCRLGHPVNLLNVTQIKTYYIVKTMDFCPLGIISQFLHEY